MRLCAYSRKLLAVAATLHRWGGVLGALDRSQRDRVARYADEIAATLARAAEGLACLETNPMDRAAARVVAEEFGRISGYLELVIGVLRHHLDGRKLAGVKRRLERLTPDGVAGDEAPRVGAPRVDRLYVAEGYFRALADSLRA